MTTVPVVARTRRGPFQLGLRVVFWLVAIVAVWMTFFINQWENARLASRIEALRPLARELTVDDPGRIAAVKLDEVWDDEASWDVYLPPGRYRVCVGTRDIDETGLARSTESSAIDPGRHRLGMVTEKVEAGLRICVILDGRPLFAIEEPRDRHATGWLNRDEISRCEQRPADQPLVLKRRRNSYSSPGSPLTTLGPTNGILFWIERAEASGDANPANPR